VIHSLSRTLAFLLCVGSLAVVAGCATKRVNLVPSSDALLRAGPDYKARVYIWNGKSWELSPNKVNIPEGWFIGPLPPTK